MKAGPISWMIKHGIAPHLLMLGLVLGGLVMSFIIRKEYLPDISLERVNISMYYPGATPDEIEASIVQPVEAVLEGVGGIKEVNTVVVTGKARIYAELQAGENPQALYQDVQQAISLVSSFPAGMEEPRIYLARHVIDVMEIVLHADLDRVGLKRLAENVRDILLRSPEISQVTLNGLPREEIHIDIPQTTLQRYDLTLSEVAKRIKQGAVEKSAGSIKSRGGDILVSVDERRFWADEFAKMPLLSDKHGDQILLGELATVTDDFADERTVTTFDGQTSIGIKIYRVGNQTPDAIAKAVQARWPEIEAMLPPTAALTVVDDDAKAYTKRLGLLIKNAVLGLLLVLVVMSLFLEYRLAFWVVAGIPSAFLGAILFLPSLGVSINMVSMFGFIIALGIVVDDAIIAGENIYEHMQEGMPFQQAAILGAKEVAKPLTFAILTNIVAFLPLLLLPGRMNLMFGAIPLVVILCFLISWVEALFILPSHLAGLKERDPSAFGRKINGLRVKCDAGLQRFIHEYYRPLLNRCLDWPGLTLALALVVLMVVLSYALSGRMGFRLMPEMEGSWVKVNTEFPDDLPMNQVLALRERVEQSAREMIERRGIKDLVLSQRSEIVETNLQVSLLLVPSEERELSSKTIKEWWREAASSDRSLRSLKFGSSSRSGSETKRASVTIEMRHDDADVLRAAIADAESRLRELNTVVGVVDSMAAGKTQWKLKLNENGRSLGLNAEGLSAQLRAAIYGAKALRQHRGHNEVTVLVRLPVEELQAANDVESLMIRTRAGGYAPLGEVAEIEKVLAPARITRRKGERVETVGADVLPEEAIPSVTSFVESELAQELKARYPGLNVSLGGEQEEIRENISRLELGTFFALALIYALLSIAFRSYSQPLVIMSIIPFGAVGAILGHMILGYSLSVVSLMGMLALAGVVVNDSLILVEYANKQRRMGASPLDAILRACERRIRPILLTTITTFGGLAPMVFETSRQAQFIVPMAVSLGFGILFTTFVCLLVLPSLYLVLERSLGNELETVEVSGSLVREGGEVEGRDGREGGEARQCSTGDEIQAAKISGLSLE